MRWIDEPLKMCVLCRVKAEDSLYTGLHLKEGQVADQLVKPSVISCSCGGVEKSCAPNLHSTPCQIVTKNVQGKYTKT